LSTTNFFKYFWFFVLLHFPSLQVRLLVNFTQQIYVNLQKSQFDISKN
jgi:hypothetical protein